MYVCGNITLDQKLLSTIDFLEYYSVVQFIFLIYEIPYNTKKSSSILLSSILFEDPDAFSARSGAYINNNIFIICNYIYIYITFRVKMNLSSASKV